MDTTMNRTLKILAIASLLFAAACGFPSGLGASCGDSSECELGLTCFENTIADGGVSGSCEQACSGSGTQSSCSGNAQCVNGVCTSQTF